MGDEVSDKLETLWEESRALRDQADDLRRRVRARGNDLAELTCSLKDSYSPSVKADGSGS